jgi:hypothetical protein
VWSTRQCLRCEFVWLDPMPLSEDIAIAYAEYYTHVVERDVQTRSLSKRIYDVATGALAAVSGLRATQKKAALM